MGSGHGGGFYSSPTLTAAWESIAANSGSDSGNAVTPEGGSASSDDIRSPPDAAIDILSSGGAAKEMAASLGKNQRTPTEAPLAPVEQTSLGAKKVFHSSGWPTL